MNKVLENLINNRGGKLEAIEEIKRLSKLLIEATDKINILEALLRETLATLRTLDTWENGDNVHHLIKRIRTSLGEKL